MVLLRCHASSLAWGVLFCLILPLVGCGGGGDGHTVNISGKVTLAGEPFSGASIRMVSKRSGASFATDLNESGEYQLELTGVHNEEVLNIEFGPAESTSGEAKLDEAGIPIGNPAPPIPKRYFEAETSGLTVTLNKNRQQTFGFALESK